MRAHAGCRNNEFAVVDPCVRFEVLYYLLVFMLGVPRDFVGLILDNSEGRCEFGPEAGRFMNSSSTSYTIDWVDRVADSRLLVLKGEFFCFA